MISADYSLTPKRSAPKAHPASELAGMYPPRKIADSVTESAANNASAEAYRAGYVRPATQTRPGFSVSANDRMRAAQAQAAGQAEGASAAAGIRAQDQAFNSQQEANWQALVNARLNSNYELQSGMNQANFQKQFARQSNALNMGMARRNAWQNIRLALLSQME